MNQDIILSAKNLSKVYGGIAALDDVSVEFRKGEVHALMGENGAGKSTLVKIFAGAVIPDQGEFTINGSTFSQIEPKEAKRHGIQLMYQELNLILSLSVAENIFLDKLQEQGLIVNYKEIQKKTRDLFERLGIEINPETLISELTVAQMQLVEIAKSIAQESKVIIMDEPTASLSVTEIEILFRLIRNLKKEGAAIVYISHRMSEVFELSDRITVMRDGKKIQTVDSEGVSREELVRLMVGRTLSESYPEHTAKIGSVVLEARHITNEKVHDVSFAVRSGEVLGIAGLMGSGRTELMRAVFGADEKMKGEVLIDGKSIRIRSPEDAVGAKIGLVPEDRKLQGVFTELPVRDNITTSVLKRISRRFIIDKKKEAGIIDKYRNSIRIKMASEDQLVKSLSGGNQQKVALSKWLATECRILILDEPTRGIDVGAKQEIYQLINKLAEEGLAIIVITSDMDELLGLVDRMIILHEGNYAGEITGQEDFTQEKVLDIASGD